MPDYFKGEKLPESTEGIKVTSWNLKWFPGYIMGKASEEAKNEHVEKVVEQLKALDSDILCLQEIKGPESINLIADRLPEYKIQMVSNFKRNLEIAIISKMPATAAFAQEFHPADLTPPRGFAFAAFQFGTDVLLTYSVHLKSNYGGIPKTIPVREESAQQIIAHAQEQKSFYRNQGLNPVVLLCGDWNSDPTQPQFSADETLKRFADAGYVWTFRGMERKDCVTWLSDGRYPDAVFDGFFGSSSGSAQISRSKVFETARSVSDHRPVSVWVKFGN